MVVAAQTWCVPHGRAPRRRKPLFLDQWLFEPASFAWKRSGQRSVHGKRTWGSWFASLGTCSPIAAASSVVAAVCALCSPEWRVQAGLCGTLQGPIQSTLCNELWAVCVASSLAVVLFRIITEHLNIILGLKRERAIGESGVCLNADHFQYHKVALGGPRWLTSRADRSP